MKLVLLASFKHVLLMKCVWGASSHYIYLLKHILCVSHVYSTLEICYLFAE